MKLSHFLLCSLFVFSLTGCSKRQSSKENITAFSKETAYRVAVLMGSTHDKYITEYYPQSTIMRLDTEPDLFVALESDKADVIVLDYAFFATAKQPSGKYVLLEEHFTEEMGIGFNWNNTPLRDQFNQFLAGIKRDGTYDEICRKWFENYATARMPEWEDKPTGTPLKIGVTGSTEAFAFIQNGEPAGFDIEVLERFGRSINRPVQFSYINFGGLIAALNSGAVDIVSSGMTITDERTKQIAFSDPYYTSKAVSVILKERHGAQTTDPTRRNLNTLDDIASSRVAVVMGNLHDSYVSDNYPTAQLMRYESYPDVFMSLDQEKSDIAGVEGIVYETTLKKKGAYEVLGVLFEDPYGVGFNLKDKSLRDQFNAFLNEIKQSGVYQEMVDRWIKHFDTAEMPHWTDQPSGPPLKLGCTGATDVFDFIKNGKNAGFDIELMERFGRYINRPVEHYILNFGGLIAALTSGKVDAISSAMTITEERSKQLAFSDPYFVSESLAVVLKERYGKSVAGNSGTGFRSVEDVKDKRFGVLMSSIQDEYVAKTYPNATVLRIDQAPDLIVALKTGQCDVIVLPFPEVREILKVNPDIAILEQDIKSVDLGIGFRDATMRDRFNEYLKKIRGNGLYDEMDRRWMDSIAEAKMPVFNFDKKTEPLLIGTTAESIPFSFIKEGENYGFDIELVTRFAADLGHPVKFSIMTFGGLIPSLASGKIDIIASSAMITEERKKEIAFSDPYYTVESTVLALKKNIGNAPVEIVRKTSFGERIKESFYNNLIVEKRYKLILNGLKQTLIITFFATLLGTLFGGIICFFRMSRRRVLNTFAKIFIQLMRGTPLLVMLMIFFYVIFASSGLSASVVAIFTFALNMAAYSSEMFRTSIEGVDRGQQEAGIALGFTKIQSFIYIILPQAVRNVLPVYKGEVISLLKMTSVVGYIAVVDLTKASDIIRSRTFDAFFPLIVVAIIYFVLAWLIGILLDYLNKKIPAAR